MKTRWLLSVASAAAFGMVITALGACAGDEDPLPIAPEEDATPAPDAGLDGDADRDGDACADCEDFPATCSEGVLCPNGPFDPAHPTGGLDLRTQINVIVGRSSSDVWAVGATGAIAHFDGTSWSRSESGTRETLHALWVRDSAEIALGTPGSVYTRGLEIEDAGPDAAAPSSGGWTARGEMSGPYDYSPSRMKLVSGWAVPDAKWFWCATTKLNSRPISAGLWRMRLSPSRTLEIERGVPSYMCGNLPCSRVRAIHGATADDLWAVGDMGATLRIGGADGDAPTIQAYDSQTWNVLRSVWAASPDDAWAVGTGGTVRRYPGHGIRWDVVTDVPTTEDLNAVGGSSASDVWVVGNAAVVFHYDGTSWSRVKIAGLGARRPNLTAVFSPAPGHVWIGGRGVILSLGGRP